MPTTPDQEASMSHKPPSPRQLDYLKALAQRTGQTFQWPKTSAQASREIRRLKNARPSTAVERAIERFGDTQAIEAAQDVAIVHDFEIEGYGTATWSQRS
jgi:alpha-ketoglutarate-dependent taurine dioxygenase